MTAAWPNHAMRRFARTWIGSRCECRLWRVSALRNKSTRLDPRGHPMQGTCDHDAQLSTRSVRPSSPPCRLYEQAIWGEHPLGPWALRLANALLMALYQVRRGNREHMRGEPHRYERRQRVIWLHSSGLSAGSPLA